MLVPGFPGNSETEKIYLIDQPKSHVFLWKFYFSNNCRLVAVSIAVSKLHCKLLKTYEMKGLIAIYLKIFICQKNHENWHFLINFNPKNGLEVSKVSVFSVPGLRD